MPFRFLMRYFGQHPEVIDRLSETKPIRRTAKLAVGLLFRARAIGEERLAGQDPQKLLQSSWREWLDSLGKPKSIAAPKPPLKKP